MTNSPYIYKIILDIEQDADNWFVACNKVTKGIDRDWSSKVPQNIVDSIRGKNRKDAYDFLIPFLKKEYIKDEKRIDNFTKRLEGMFDQKINAVCRKMVEITGKPLYRNNFTVYLTTISRGSYDYISGSMRMKIGHPYPMKSFMHELLHFQFLYYWATPDSDIVSKLSDEQFQWIKESLTVLLDENLLTLIELPDQGYPQHLEFRKILHEHWKENKDFNKLVEYATKRVVSFVT